MDFSSYTLSVKVIRICMDVTTKIPLPRQLKIAFSINTLSTNFRNASFAETLNFHTIFNVITALPVALYILSSTFGWPLLFFAEVFHDIHHDTLRLACKSLSMERVTGRITSSRSLISL